MCFLCVQAHVAEAFFTFSLENFLGMFLLKGDFPSPANISEYSRDLCGYNFHKDIFD